MSYRSAILAAGLILHGTLGAPASAQVAPDPPDAIHYTVADCLRIALENNLSLVVARKEPRIAEQRIESSQAKFDGALSAAANYSEASSDQTISNNSLPGLTAPGSNDSDTLSASGTFSHLLRFGGNYDVTLGISDSESMNRGVSQSIGFFQDSSSMSSGESLTLRYEMPLLAGFGREVNTVDVLLARSALSMSKEDLRLNAIHTIQATEDAYWDLVAARAGLGVARESLTLAKDLLHLNQKKVDVGTLAPIEITQAEAGVASREEGVIVAETTVENAEDNLRRLLAIPHDDTTWSRRIVPTDPPRFEAQSVNVEAALVTAMAQRPEIVNARQAVRDNELSERVAKRGLRHTLNLEAAVTPTEGDSDFRLVDLAPPTTVLADTKTESDGTDWRVGLVYRFPLHNRSAKANHAIASLNREKSEVNLESVEQDIRVDVRTAARNVESGAKRVAAAKASTVLQRKTLEAEQKKFENGMSTSFELLRIQTDVSNAQLAEIRAILDYTKALAELERAQGTLLEARNLAVGE